MHVIKSSGQLTKMAIIDPKLAQGQPGQYVSMEDTQTKLAVAAALARLEGKEIRWYYKDLKTSGDEKVAMQVIVTEVPPGHVQPFHAHHVLHETTTVESGCVLAIDSDTLTEADKDEIRAQGTLLVAGDMVIEDPDVRHTIMNPDTGTYCIMITVQTPRIPMAEFPHDWVRQEAEAVKAHGAKIVQLQQKKG
jgi:quercetin dioxygenase-like cupin family protein